MTTRGVILETAIAMFREDGVANTTVLDIARRCGAPPGQVLQHFPGGKDQLAAEATAAAGAFMASLLEALDEADGAEAVQKFVDYWTLSMRENDFRDGCPAAAAALAPEVPAARRAAGIAFGHWEELVTRWLTDRGHDPDQAASLATLVIAAVEGALILSRAQESNEPLRKVGVRLTALLAGEPGPSSVSGDEAGSTEPQLVVVADA